MIRIKLVQTGKPSQASLQLLANKCSLTRSPEKHLLRSSLRHWHFTLACARHKIALREDKVFDQWRARKLGVEEDTVDEVT